MLGALTVLLVYQLVGEVLVQLSGLPVPGPVVGMLLLFVTLLLRGREPARPRACAIPRSNCSRICRCSSCRRAWA